MFSAAINWFKSFRRVKLDPARRVHIARVPHAQQAELKLRRVRLTGKKVWMHDFKCEHLDRLAATQIGEQKIVAYGDVTEREIAGTTFHAIERDYYYKD